MKKRTKWLLLFVAIFAAFLILVGCNKQPNNPPPTQSQQTVNTTQDQNTQNEAVPEAEKDKNCYT